MKFLILSDAGDSLGLALRIQEEGNEVLFWVRRDSGENVGNNLTQKNVAKLSIFSPDVVVADCTGFGVLCDLYRSQGIPVVGGSTLMDNLEMDRGFATEVMKECGLSVPKSKTFNSFEEATSFIQDKKNSEKRYVFKPSGSDSGNIPSFVSKDSESLIKMFEKYKKIVSGSLEFDLQEFHEGVDISTEMWFSNGEPLIDMGNHTIETKHLLNGDLGPSGGCTGNVVFKADQGSVLFKETIAKMYKFCAENHYTGPLDVNAIVCEDGIYSLEFTPRFGYDATPTLFCSLLEGEIGGFLASVAQGQTGGNRAYADYLSRGFGGGIKLSLNPWPFEEGHSTGQIPLGIKTSQLFGGQFFPYNVQLNEHEEPETCNAYGMVGIAMGHGNTIEDSMNEALKQAKKIPVPDVQYRTDLGEYFTKRYKQIGKLLDNLS